jgi:hypothetical protein
MLILQFYYMFMFFLQFDRIFNVISVIDKFSVEGIHDFEVRIAHKKISPEGYFFYAKYFGINVWVI